VDRGALRPFSFCRTIANVSGSAWPRRETENREAGRGQHSSAVGHWLGTQGWGEDREEIEADGLFVYIAGEIPRRQFSAGSNSFPLGDYFRGGLARAVRSGAFRCELYRAVIERGLSVFLSGDLRKVRGKRKRKKPFKGIPNKNPPRVRSLRSYCNRWLVPITFSSGNTTGGWKTRLTRSKHHGAGDHAGEKRFFRTAWEPLTISARSG